MKLISAMLKIKNEDVVNSELNHNLNMIVDIILYDYILMCGLESGGS